MRSLTRLTLLIATNVWLVLSVAAAIAGHGRIIQGDIGLLRGTIGPRSLGLCVNCTESPEWPRVTVSSAETAIAWELEPVVLADTLRMIGMRYYQTIVLAVCWCHAPPTYSLALTHMVHITAVVFVSYVLYRHRRRIVRRVADMDS